MTKEILTKDNIQKDVLAYVKRITGNKDSYYFGGIVLSTALVLLIATLDRWKIAFVFAILPVFCLLQYIPIWRASRAERGAASRGDFTVTKANLSHIAEEIIHEPRFAGKHVHTTRVVRFLYFPCGQWRIQPRNYTWSKDFYMSGQGVENTSLIGDEFYIAISNNTQEICAVYNTKFFTYTDNV